MYINVCFHHVLLTCFTAVSIRVPSGTKATYLQLFSQVALFDTIAFPQFGRQLAPGTLDPRVKIRGLLPPTWRFRKLPG